MEQEETTYDGEAVLASAGGAVGGKVDATREAREPAAARKAPAAPTVPAARSRVRRVLSAVGHVLLAVFVLACFVAFAAERWLFATWADLSLEEIIFHLRMSLGGTNGDMVVSAVLRYALPAVLGAGVVTAAVAATRRRPFLHRLVMALALALSLGLGCFAMLDLDARLGVASYLQAASQTAAARANAADAGQDAAVQDFVGAHYVDPASVDLSFPARKRNVIYLFLESMEMTYSDVAHGGAFPQDVIPELTQLAAGNDCFSGGAGQLAGGISLPGTTWTAGAMFGQTSGVPLKVPISGNDMGEEGEFFPGLETMGDVLERAGYRQVLLIGSEAVFGGRDLLFTEHGGFEIRDYTYAVEHGLIPSDYHVFWGYEDEKLFAIARQTLEELASGEEPFNLTMLTVDTHFEDGYVCDLCGHEFGDDQYANVMACSSRQVAEFVAWVQEQPWGDDTTIVICGDHPTMDVDFCADVPESYQRRTYTCIVNSAVEPQRAGARTYSTLDLFPTTLAAMGVEVPGDALGLGVNLYGARDTLLEELGVEAVEAELTKPSEFLNTYSRVELDDSFVDELVATAHTDPHDDGAGHLYFTVRGLSVLNVDLIESMTLELSDSRDGRVTRSECYVYQYTPNAFVGRLDTQIPVEDLPYLDGVVHMTVTGVGDLELAPLTHTLSTGI